MHITGGVVKSLFENEEIFIAMIEAIMTPMAAQTVRPCLFETYLFREKINNAAKAGIKLYSGFLYKI